MHNYSTGSSTLHSKGGTREGGYHWSAGVSLPPPDNMGVSAPDIQTLDGQPSIHCDYLTVTVWGLDWREVYDKYLWPFIQAELVDQGHGGRFYSSTWRSILGVTLRCEPVNKSEGDHWTLEIPGQACQIVGYENLCELYQSLQREAVKVRVNRVDVAVDNCPFEPYKLHEAAIVGAVRSKSHQETIGYRVNDFELNEAGGVGTQSFTMGSRESGRYLRCYNKHGFTRLEIEFKDDWADRLAVDFFIDCTPWDTGIGYIRDFVDFLAEPLENLRDELGHIKSEGIEQFLADWWCELVDFAGRASARLEKSGVVVTIARVKGWLMKQVSAAFSVVADFGGQSLGDFVGELMAVGSVNRERSLTYRPLLEGI
jgi:hypothetical protein